jgi:hypothetical protein
MKIYIIISCGIIASAYSMEIPGDALKVARAELELIQRQNLAQFHSIFSNLNEECKDLISLRTAQTLSLEKIQMCSAATECTEQYVADRAMQARSNKSSHYKILGKLTEIFTSK